MLGVGRLVIEDLLLDNMMNRFPWKTFAWCLKQEHNGELQPWVDVHPGDDGPHLPGSLGEQALHAAVQPAQVGPEQQLHLPHQLVGGVFGLQPGQGRFLYMPARPNTACWSNDAPPYPPVSRGGYRGNVWGPPFRPPAAPDDPDCVYLISSQADHITVYSRSVAEYSDGFKKLGNNVCRSRMYSQPDTTKYLTKHIEMNEWIS